MLAPSHLLVPMLLSVVETKPMPEYGRAPSLELVDALEAAASSKHRLRLKRRLRSAKFTGSVESGFAENPERQSNGSGAFSRNVTLVPRLAFYAYTYSDSGLDIRYRVNSKGELEYRLFADTAGVRQNPWSHTQGRLHLGGQWRFFNRFTATGSASIARGLNGEHPDLEPQYMQFDDAALSSRTLRTLTVGSARVGAYFFGRALHVRAHYGLIWTDFDRARWRYFSSLRQRPAVSATWQVRDNIELQAQSALLFNRFRLPRGTRPQTAAHGDSNIVENTVRASFALPPYFRVHAQLGVADGFARNVKPLHIPVGAIGLDYDTGAIFSGNIQVYRKLEPTSLFSMVDTLGLQLSAKARFSAATYADMSANFSRYAFAGAEHASTRRNDTLFRARISIGHRFATHYQIALVDQIENRSSNFVGPEGSAGYRRNHLYLRLSITL